MKAWLGLDYDSVSYDGSKVRSQRYLLLWGILRSIAYRPRTPMTSCYRPISMDGKQERQLTAHGRDNLSRPTSVGTKSRPVVSNLFVREHPAAGGVMRETVVCFAALILGAGVLLFVSDCGSAPAPPLGPQSHASLQTTVTT